MKTDIIVGLQYGDEGKGKAAAYLASRFDYDVVCRANGGPNAGHTVVTDDGTTYKFSQLPGATPYCKKVFIGAGCVVNPAILVKEIQEYEKISKKKIRVYIHPNTHVILKTHIDEDIFLEKEYNIGTTKQGIGPCYSTAALRTGVIFSQFIENIYEPINKKILELIKLGNIYVKNPLNHEDNILVEMSQGYELDPFVGNYPYVTSSSSHPGLACASLNIPTQSINRIYGILKPYVTYVGGDKNFLDLPQKEGDRIRELGKEYGVVTGRARRIGRFNEYNIGEAISDYGVTDLFVNKLDILEKLKQDTIGFLFTMKQMGLPTLYGYGPKTSEYRL